MENGKRGTTMKVFLIYKDCGEIREVVAACSTFEKAEAKAKELNEKSGAFDSAIQGDFYDTDYEDECFIIDE